MDFRIIAAARPSIAYARDGVKFFEDRLRPLGKVELRYVKAGSSEDVSARLLEASEGCLRIAMDERGENWTTRQLEKHVREWQMRGDIKHVAFLIGAADGHTPALRAACDHVLCLGKHTMQHELALVVLLEQIYRIHTLLAGSPYHRD
ncbi:MAG: 23S rRNA (pseudouridine(1915)-N(3))-methyltransferase RlmH [Akkermansia sp.]|nr:23S rRNA (pseudouridine(1915)-N(3))-methyltransferase RlmH [Akkermansia sp.]